MSSFDGAEVYELVGLYLIDILSEEFGDSKTGLYREDGLGCFQNLFCPEFEKIKKKLCKIFKKHGSNITVECKLRITDFLNATADLQTGKYYPFREANNELLCFHKQSNHSSSITKKIPAMISKWIPNISCDKEYFDKTVPVCNKALKKWFQRKYQIYTKTS